MTGSRPRDARPWESSHDRTGFGPRLWPAIAGTPSRVVWHPCLLGHNGQSVTAHPDSLFSEAMVMSVIVRIMEAAPDEASKLTTAPQSKKTSDRGAVTAAATPATPIPGEVISTWMDSWTFCKATAKSLSSYHWLPWLGGVSALLSALAATAVFTNLEEDHVSTVAKVAVGSVAVLVALITALQSWTSGRTKELVGQMSGFDRLHRKIERDIENHSKPVSDNDYAALDRSYAEDIRQQYIDLVTGMSQVSNRHWDAAKRDVRCEMEAELRRFGYLGATRG